MDSPFGNCIHLLLGENYGTSNIPNPFTFEHRAKKYEKDEEVKQCDDDIVGV